MTEKINGHGFRATDIASSRRAEPSKAAGSQASRGERASSGETVKLTASGLLLSKLEEALQRVPVVDAERVQTIKDAIAAGTYLIDERRIAASLLKLERELPAE